MSYQSPTALKSFRWLLIAIPILLLITVGVYLIWEPPPTQIQLPSSAPPASSKPADLAPFGRPPDWS
ncbi:hypothetical protein N8504_05630, partial [Akkermansiaceae bacterium]|nr:hypothetical protein [Akkermansiaceae bacterium]